MSVKDIKESMVARREEFTVEHGGKTLTFIAKEVGYISALQMAILGQEGKNSFAYLIAQSISDKDGNQFTYDEVLQLDEKVGQAFMNAALSVNKRGDAEKK